MKRRGFTPNLRTYTTLFGGLINIKDWKTYSKLLEQVHNLHENYQAYVQAVKAHDTSSSEISTAPTAAYIRILGDAGLYQEIFDVYYSLDQEGPLSPSPNVFTAIFDALSRKRSPPSPNEARDGRARNASDVKSLWKQMIKIAERDPSFQIDAYLIANAIKVLAPGRAIDHLFAFDIIEKFVGLCEIEKTSVPGKVKLSRVLLSEILWLCLSSKKYRLCIHFVEQVKQWDKEFEAKGGETVLDAGHMNSVLKSYAALSIAGSHQESQQALSTLQWMIEEDILKPNPNNIRPTLVSYSAALSACWRTGDWTSAAKIFEMMTGWNAADFGDENGTVPELRESIRRRKFPPDSDTTSSLVRAAVHSRDSSTMRQCARIVDRMGMERFLVESPGDGAHNSPFHVSKFAEAMLDLLQEILPVRSDIRTIEERRWAQMKREVEKVLVVVNEGRRRPISRIERPLGKTKFGDLVIEDEADLTDHKFMDLH